MIVRAVDLFSCFVLVIMGHQGRSSALFVPQAYEINGCAISKRGIGALSHSPCSHL